MSQDWERALPAAVPDGKGRFRAALRVFPSGVVIWESTSTLASEADALSYAGRMRDIRMSAERAEQEEAVRIRKPNRKTEDLKLPEDVKPALPVPPAANEPQYPALGAERPFDGDWAAQEAGVELLADTDQGREVYAGTLHDRRRPYTVRWRCAHSHYSYDIAENCALDQRKLEVKRLAEAKQAAEKDKAAWPGLDVTHPGGAKQEVSVGVGLLHYAKPSVTPPLQIPADRVHVTPDTGVTVVVKAAIGSRVTTRCTDGGALEVVITPPERDKD